MNAYLAKLRGLAAENRHQSEPSKPSKLGFEGFEGDQSCPIFGNEAVEFGQGCYRHAMAAHQSKCPELVELDRWQQATSDAETFLAKWGAQAHALGWTARELFGLHPVPEWPAVNFSRLSRRDSLGLIWLLQGRPVVALTETEAAIQSAGAVVMYRKHRKPALGKLGDNLADMAYWS
jgi:hypothetical protein